MLPVLKCVQPSPHGNVVTQFHVVEFPQVFDMKTIKMFPFPFFFAVQSMAIKLAKFLNNVIYIFIRKGGNTMKRRWILRLFAGMIIVILCTGCINTSKVAEEKEKNLILNGDFEEGTDDTPDSWEKICFPSPGLRLYWDRKISHTGKASISIINEDEYNNEVNAWIQRIEKFPSETRLVLSGYIKTENVSPVGIVSLSVRVKDVEGNFTDIATASCDHSLIGTNNWIEVKTDVFIPANSSEVCIVASLKEKGHIWFDDIKLSEVPPRTKEWTLMFYDDADFPGMNPKEVFQSEAYSTENLNVLILEDPFTEPASTWCVQEKGKAVKIKDNGEVNMASYETLRDFIAFCKKWYPAKRYMLLLYDHGDGWKGACADITNSPGDWLTPSEMKKALTETGGIDIIGFSAPCLMSAIESIYELRECVDVYIGSEGPGGYISWIGVIGPLCETLDKNTEASDIDIGYKIIDLIKKDNSVTMCAVRTDKTEELVESLDIFASELIQLLPSSYRKIEDIRNNTLSFGDSVVDIYDLLYQCNLVFPEIKGITEEIMEDLNEAIINEYHGDKYPDSHGISIYFPDIHSEYFEYIWDPAYSTSDLEFTEYTQWDEFLYSYLHI